MTTWAMTHWLHYTNNNANCRWQREQWHDGYLNSCLFSGFLFVFPLAFLLSIASICTSTTKNNHLDNQCHQILICIFTTNFQMKVYTMNAKVLLDHSYTNTNTHSYVFKYIKPKYHFTWISCRRASDSWCLDMISCRLFCASKLLINAISLA